MTFDDDEDDADMAFLQEDEFEEVEHYIALASDHPELGLTDAQMILLSALILSNNMSWSIH